MDKTVAALERGVHVLVVDVFPPGSYDPNGIHSEILCRMNPAETPYTLPDAEPQTLVSYVAGPAVEVYLEHVALDAEIPDIPLFLSRERYVNVPLEPTYMAAYRGMPNFWRNVLES